MKSSTLGLAALAVSCCAAQNVTVPDTCTEGFSAGVDEVIFTIPYTYAQALSIIGSYQNLTWSGNTPDTVTLNGSDNTVGTARSYSLAGANLVETLLVYQSPPEGPYYEVHNLALITVPPFGNVSVYSQYDATNVTSVCGGRASEFNFTARFCADNVTAATGAFHYVHTQDAMGVAMLLGGANFTSCEALEQGNATSTSTTTGTGVPMPTYTGGAVTDKIAMKRAVWLGVGAVVMAAM